MPSQLHEALVELFRARPTLAPELLRAVGAVSLPRRAVVTQASLSFGEVKPPQYSADLVLNLQWGKRRTAIIVEVQLDADSDDRRAKRRSWLRYAVWQWAAAECPTYLVVVTPSRNVERWASRPIAIGHPAFALVPIVLGPSNLPALRDRHRARSSPELAVLSAVVHGHGPHAAEIGEVAAEAALAAGPERGTLYLDLVLAALSGPARREVEAIMVQKYEYQSDFARKYFGQGEAKGLAEGEARGKADDVLRVLETRGFSVPDEVAERVRSCRDIATLDTWLTRAVTLSDITELFG